MRDIRKIKQLRTQLSLATSDAEALKLDVSLKQKEYSQKLQVIEKLKKEIDKIDDDSNLKVSEHAILRYLERVKGLNIEEIEKEILSENVLDLVEKLGGNGSYPNKNFSVVMKNFTVVTVK